VSGSRCKALLGLRRTGLQRTYRYPLIDVLPPVRSLTDAYAMQHCRFHFAYYPDGYDRDWSDIDPDEMDSETGELPTHRDWDEIESCYTFEYEDYSKTPAIELCKAEAVFKGSRWMPTCEGCEETFTASSQGKEVGGRCRCDMWAHFVGKRWLCIPCFFVEETKAYEDVQWKVGADGKVVCQFSRCMFAQ
jgi:hypothetical protein